MSASARVLLLSQRGLAPVISRCCSYEFEHVIRFVDEADQIAPTYRHGALELLDRAVNKIGRRVPPVGRINPGIRPLSATRHYPLFFAVFQFATDATSLNAVRGGAIAARSPPAGWRRSGRGISGAPGPDCPSA